MEIIVYSSANCGFCKKQREFLEKHEIAFTEKDIHQSKDIFDEFQALGGYGTPFTIIRENGHISKKVMGFNRHQLLEELVQNATSEHTVS
ncbi:glutaredoxin family protein [Priestia koreensis]|uniref:glutaredoxin family protein n=1 Tax=Priestia koreensis TaxID=284581 RepID=UPI00203F2072|nr:glutaredoxin family protein [Priestia koreensis]MCM3006831.1 glutaredoxin family protein [Priestia koreensis]